MTRERGTLSGWFATSVSSMPVRSAARNRISLITTGHASASTQIFISSPSVSQLRDERVEGPQLMADGIARGRNSARIGDTAVQLLPDEHLLQ